SNPLFSYLALPVFILYAFNAYMSSLFQKFFVGKRFPVPKLTIFENVCHSELVVAFFVVISF
ncbi:MAG: hypothetical protein RSA27_06635, partial [Oscillospiraceae bacterium]